MKERPIGVTVLAILAGVAAVLAAINALQFLGIFPFFIGSVPAALAMLKVRDEQADTA